MKVKVTKVKMKESESDKSFLSFSLLNPIKLSALQHWITYMKVKVTKVKNERK